MSTREKVAFDGQAKDTLGAQSVEDAKLPPAVRLLQGLQASAGNAAVARLLSRRAQAAAGAAPPLVGSSTLARQQTGTTPSPSGSAGAPPGSVAGQLPPGADITSLGFSFQIPEGKHIADKAYTTDMTTVTVSITHTGISLGMSPPIHIRPLPAWTLLLGVLPFFALSDCEWSGAEYSFGSASVTSVSLADTGIGISIQSRVRGDVTAEVTRLLAGTRAAVAGYDPATDPDPVGTVATMKANAAAGGSSGSDVGAMDVSNLDVSASATLPAAELLDEQHSGVRLTGGAHATMDITMDGTMQDVMDPAKRKIRSITIESDGITLVQNGDPVAKLKRVYISQGGAVTIGDFESLGGLGLLEGIAGLVGLVGGMAQGQELGGRQGADLLGQSGMQAGAGTVHRWGRAEIEAALTPKIQELVRTNRNAVPGIDLAQLLGI